MQDCIFLSGPVPIFCHPVSWNGELLPLNRSWAQIVLFRLYEMFFTTSVFFPKYVSVFKREVDIIRAAKHRGRYFRRRQRWFHGHIFRATGLQPSIYSHVLVFALHSSTIHINKCGWVSATYLYHLLTNIFPQYICSLAAGPCLGPKTT